MITGNGQMPTSLILGYSRCPKPIDWRVNPDAETTDWRARRGKTAHRVRREGTAETFPTPIQRSIAAIPVNQFTCSTYRFGLYPISENSITAFFIALVESPHSTNRPNFRNDDEAVRAATFLRKTNEMDLS